MKRMIISGCLAAIAAGLVAAPASAAVRHFHGPVTGGGNVTFDVNFQYGTPKSVSSVHFNNVRVHCADGARGPHDFAYLGTRPVVNRQFSYTFQTFKANFHGTIRRTGTSAFGTVSYGPNTISGHPRCTTGGPKSWTAST
jgi:hypothetical protein